MIPEITEKIKLLCYEKRMSINQLAEEIGMSSSLHTTLKNNSLRVDTLLKISKVLQVPVSYFISSEQNSTTVNDSSEKIELLQKEAEQLFDTYKIEVERLEAKKRLINWIYFSIKFNILGASKEVSEENHSPKSEKLYNDIKNLLATINKSERLDYEDESQFTVIGDKMIKMDEKSLVVISDIKKLSDQLSKKKKEVLTKKT